METISTCNDVRAADFQTEWIIAGYFLVPTMAKCRMAPARGERISDRLYFYHGLLAR